MLRKINYLELKITNNVSGEVQNLGIFKTAYDLYDFILNEIVKVYRKEDSLIVAKDIPQEVIDNVYNLRFIRVKDIINTLFSNEELGLVVKVSEVDTYKPLNNMLEIYEEIQSVHL